MKLPRLWLMAGLAMSLATAVALSWQWLWAQKPDQADAAVLRADSGYWISMFIAGTLGTVIGDYCSHNLHLGDAAASILLSPILELLFVVARGGLLRSLWFYWLTVAVVRAAGTSVGHLVASWALLGLPLSTLVTESYRRASYRQRDPKNIDP